MRNTMRVVSAVLGLALAAAFAGCRESRTPRHGEAKVWGSLAQVTKPAPGMSKVVFIWPPVSRDWAAGMYLYADGTPVGHAHPSGYCQYECTPGKHVFAGALENFGFVEADLLPDRIYYIKVSTAPGWRSARVNLWPLYPGCEGGVWNEVPKWLGDVRELTPATQGWEESRCMVCRAEALTPAEQARGQRFKESVHKNYGAYYEPWSKDPKRRRLLPEHGLTEPIAPVW